MKILKVLIFSLAVSLLAGMITTPARADQWNKETKLTFSQPTEIPGMVLPAGTYTFTLSDSVAYRHIVQVWNEDHTQLITTVLAIPNYRLEPTGETVIEFHERPGDSPHALRAWFYPGDNFGQEFAYPEARAMQLAEASHEIVPAETAEATASNLKTVPLVAVTPERRETPLTEAIQVAPPELSREPVTVAEAKELPKTASVTPLIALSGLALLGLGVGLSLLARRAA